MKGRVLFSILLVIVLLSSTLAPPAAAQGPSTGTDSEVQEERKPETKETVGEYVAPTRAGVRGYEHEYEWVGSQGIPDGACPDMTTILLNVPDSFIIKDVRVGFNALHTYRHDIELRLMSPQGTLVDLFLNQDGDADNFDVLFEDGGGPVDSTDHNIDPPYYEYSWVPWSPLAAFVGEDAVGNWELQICDGFGLDTGSVERWALFFNYIPSPDLGESYKEVWPTTAEPGDFLTYTVHISNTGEAPAWQAVMTDVIPAGTEFISGSLTYDSGIGRYDPDDDAVYWHQVLPPDYRYFVAAAFDGSTVYEIDLIKAGIFVDGTWGTIRTCTVEGIGDNVGIDYDAQNGVLYHSDLGSDNIVVTDLECNVLDPPGFTCVGPNGFNTGVTYVEGSEPPEVWVTDPASNTTTRCEALLQQGVLAVPAPVVLVDTEVASLRELDYSGPGPAAPGDPIEQFPNTWAPHAVGLVYDPTRDLVRYAHERDIGEDHDTIWAVDWPEPHPVLGSCALSAVNPGWPFSLDDRDGAAYDFESDTYFLTDFNGDLVNHDDNIAEIDAQCNILHAWETDGPDNDSYDGSIIDTIMDIAVVPGPPPEEVVVTFQVEVVDVPCGDTIVNEATITDPEAPNVVTVQAETLIACVGPDITVEPLSLHADQCAEEQMTLELSICNDGDLSLEWEATEVSADIPWVSEVPTQGLVFPGECMTVEVTFDSSGMDPGDYAADLLIGSNDPDTPEVIVPVTLTVWTPAAGIGFTWMPTEPTVDTTVYFTATEPLTGTPPFTYTWDFDDGMNDHGMYVTHTYTAAGDYDVALWVENACGEGLVTDTVTVETPSPSVFYYYLPVFIQNYY